MMEEILGAIEKDYLQISLVTGDRSNRTDFLQKSWSIVSWKPFQEILEDSLMNAEFSQSFKMLRFL